MAQPMSKHAPRLARLNQPDLPLPASTALCSSWGQAERVLSFLRQPARPRKVRWPAGLNERGWECAAVGMRWDSSSCACVGCAAR